MQIAKDMGQDFDVMIEAKLKDKALLKLVEDLASMRGVKRTGGATLVLNKKSQEALFYLHFSGAETPISFKEF